MANPRKAGIKIKLVSSRLNRDNIFCLARSLFRHIGFERSIFIRCYVKWNVHSRVTNVLRCRFFRSWDQISILQYIPTWPTPKLISTISFKVSLSGGVCVCVIYLRHDDNGENFNNAKQNSLSCLDKSVDLFGRIESTQVRGPSTNTDRKTKLNLPPLWWKWRI